jgi:hypothetical protein
MMIKAVLTKGRECLGEIPIQVEGPDDLVAGAKEAYEAFRKAFPSLSLFDDGMVVSFKRLDRHV